MRKDIGIGVAGTGLGSLLLRVNHNPGSRLKVRGVYDADPVRRHQRYAVGKDIQALQQEFGVDFVARSYEELLTHPGIDWVAVFSPCPLHFDQITAALRAGKHVIVTKPMVVSLDEAREVVRLVDETGRKLLVAQSMRWNSMFLSIHDLHTRGELGKIRLAEAYYVHDMRPVFDVSPWRYQMPQDLMYGGVCHPVDLLRWFLGEVDEVSAYGNRLGLEERYPADLPLNFVISLRYRTGAIGRVLGAYDVVHPPSHWSMPFHGVGIGLYGTKASLFNDRIVREYYPGGRPREEKIEPRGGHVDHAGEVLSALYHFEDCVLNDRQPLVDVRDGAQVVAICAACWESIRTGKPVTVTREFDRKT